MPARRRPKRWLAKRKARRSGVGEKQGLALLALAAGGRSSLKPGRLGSGLGPRGQTIKKDQALFQLGDTEEFVGGVCLGDVAGATNDRRSAALLE